MFHYVFILMLSFNVRFEYFPFQVHACDVVDKMLQENVQNINDFEWISQLR